MGRPRTPIGTHGEVHYTDTPSGKVKARVRLREYDGRTRLVSATGRSKAEALRLLNKRIADNDLARTSTHGGLSADSLFGDLVDAWLQHLDDTNRLADSTRYRYERDMLTHVLPAFEHLALREITVRRVDQLLQQLQRRSYNRAQKARVVLSLAFKLAVRWEVVDRNPVRDTEPLVRPAKVAQALNVQTVQLIRDLVADWEAGRAGKSGPKPDGQVLAVIEAMLGTSARIGEVLALRRCDLDLDRKRPTVRIAGTIISINGKPTIRQDHPKTSRSRRTIVVPPFTVAALRSRLARIGDVEPEHLVFFTRNGTPITANNYRRSLRRILDGSEAAGVTPHAFRRTVATTVDRAVGIDLAAELLGHTTTEVTRVHYIEPNEYVNPATADILQRSLGPDAKVTDPRKASKKASRQRGKSGKKGRKTKSS
ncbi:site-specific integrase [Xylanimonas ulmi]|uniref:Site-specific recombinase XerD n=1 Tax=Xylanimonas ulmi TaxID=228973 RepID=A0A4Q7M2G1_9MICO|nr:tyrosine-type recombinase/integrase [Xylanibacterium ulmi]RZS60638.1 site-specific recombinase XerD [Xylanibacterium ulmi]